MNQTQTRPTEKPPPSIQPSWQPTFYRPTAEEVHLNMAVFSIPGVGKTTLAASASTVAEMAPVAVINAESGMEALTEEVTDEDGKKIVDRSQLEVVDFSDFGDLKKLFDYFAFSKHGYKTLVLDTLDEILGRCLAKWERYYIPVNAEGLPQDRSNDDRMGLKVYNRATKEMTELVRRFRDLPMHVIFTAHETDRALEQNGPPRVRMDLTPALYAFVEGALSVIGRLQYRELPKQDGQEEAKVVRVITFQSAGETIRVKDRTPGQKMSRMIVNPTMSKLWDRRCGR